MFNPSNNNPSNFNTTQSQSKSTNEHDEPDLFNDSISLNLNDDSFIGGDDHHHLTPKPNSIQQQSQSQSQSKSQSQKFKRIGSDHQINLITNQEHLLKKSKSNDHDHHLIKTHDDDDHNINHNHKWIKEIKRNEQLEKERDWLREMNKILDLASDSLQNIHHKFKNMEIVTNTSHLLLNEYSNILNQTEQVKELISNPNWKGYELDVKRQKEQELKRLEELKKQEEEEERKKIEEQKSIKSKTSLKQQEQMMDDHNHNDNRNKNHDSKNRNSNLRFNSNLGHSKISRFKRS